MINEIIFGFTQEKAQEKLEDFINNDLYIFEKVLSRDRNYATTNIRTIYAFEYGIFTKIKRCEVAHVDKDISVRYLYDYILPMVINSSGESGKIRYF